MNHLTERGHVPESKTGKPSGLSIYRKSLVLALFFCCTVVQLDAQISCATAERTPTAGFGFRSSGSTTTITAVTATNSNGTGWTGTGGGAIFTSAGATLFSENGVTQTLTLPLTNVNLKGSGAVVNVNIIPRNSLPANSGTSSTAEVVYNGVIYGRVITAAGSTTNSTFTALNSASSNLNGTVSFGTHNWLLTLPSGIPNNGNLSVRFILGNTNGDDFEVSRVSFLSCPIVYSGTVFRDANGMNNGVIDGSPTTLPTGLSVGLYDAGNNLITSVPVAANGTYTLLHAGTGNYTLRLIGLSSTYVNTGEKLGTEAASDGLANGITSMLAVGNVINNTDKTGNNFGINERPVANSVTHSVSGAPVAGTPVNLGSTPMQGSDVEDQPGMASWSGKSVVITSLPPNGWFTLSYNGNPVTAANTIITNYDPALLTIIPNASAPAGTNNTSFEFATIDQVNSQSPAAATYTIDFTASLPVNFGSVTAHLIGEYLTIKWTTLSETNNDHFEIEGSGDGVNFASLAIVPSGAFNGMSANELNYIYRYTLSPVNSLLFLLWLPLLSVVLLLTRRNRMVWAGASLVIFCMTGLACNKASDLSDTSPKVIYIRIAQVDKDGGKTYSTVVKAVAP